GVAAPINYSFKRRELASYMKIIVPAAALVDDSTAGAVMEAATELRLQPMLIAVGGDEQSDLSLRRLAAAAPASPSAPDPDEPAVILHTSGTTGLPKAVVRTHGDYAAFVAVWARNFVSDRDRTLCFMPLYHQAALVVGWLAGFGKAAAFFYLQR